MAIIKFEHVNKFYGTGLAKVHVLHDVSFSAEKGEFILILGPSGAGKSTFLSIAGNLLAPTDGEVWIDGKKITAYTEKERERLRLEKLGFILQSHALVPYLTVAEQFELVKRVKKSGNLTKQQLQELLSSLGIAELQNKYPSELSGGQSQRVAIARALYTDPKIILADEPTAALDSKRVLVVGQLLKELATKQQKTVIVVTHDLRLTQVADKVYQILDGHLTLQK
ncbi:ABC transporter ATP-binding protein [Ligilactobacillus faecis]|uniref:Putative hemin import ATP-binding protein HrtA n=1 Tax=Ligilactobacillus faecis TaxID=762833 RepID=A0ABV4DP85_9LACO